MIVRCFSRLVLVHCQTSLSLEVFDAAVGGFDTDADWL